MYHKTCIRPHPLTVILLACLWLLPADVAGKVSPLEIIQQQIQTPNMLVFLDTSGSMADLPGGQAVDVGIDCDKGDMCSEIGFPGRCYFSYAGKYGPGVDKDYASCTSDADCRLGWCTDDIDAQGCQGDNWCRSCSTNSAWKCLSAQNCGRCTNNSNQQCTTDADCGAGNKCAGNSACSNDPNRKCRTSADCVAPATCIGWAACSGDSNRACTTNADCTGAGTCDINSHVCNDVPVQCAGACSNNPATACTGNATCGAGNTCNGVCNDYTLRCTTSADCSGGQTCTTEGDVGGGAPPGRDFCVPAGSLPHTRRMCAKRQVACYSDADCAVPGYADIPGDTCVAADSRLWAAKRVVNSVVQKYYNVMNFGLMSFFQNPPFFQYQRKVTSLPWYTAEIKFLAAELLDSHSCMSFSGPLPACTINFIDYTLRATANSRYRVNLGGGNVITEDRDFCGFECPVTAGSGIYEGSYYDYTRPGASNTSNGTAITLPAYQGKIYVSGPDTFAYRYYNINRKTINGVYGNTTYGTWNAFISGGQDASFRKAMWNVNLVPFLDTSATITLASQQAMARAVNKVLDKFEFGGLTQAGTTPTGGSFLNTSVGTQCPGGLATSSCGVPEHSVYHYMSRVKAENRANGVACRKNTVVLVTDGNPSDGDASDPDCALANPNVPACPSPAVKNIYRLRTDTDPSISPPDPAKTFDVETFVIGFGLGNDSVALNNMAKAGGTVKAVGANSDAELQAGMEQAIYGVAQGSYATSTATASASTLDAAGALQFGTLLLDSRADYPRWQGSLIAYDTTVSPPALLWNAATIAFDYNPTDGTYFKSTTPVDRTNDWKYRNVWTWDTTVAPKVMVKIQVNTDGTIANKAQLQTLGLGTNDDEAERIARWMLGDPAMGNPAVLGAIINSTPIDVGPPGQDPLPGGAAFYTSVKDRPFLAYLGSDDGMLHAFFTKDVTVGAGPLRKAGEEAFAFVPPDMFPVITKLYSRGGQSPDPRDHIYGLASSPKVKNLCVANCNSAATAQWKTLLIMTEGYGGSDAFTLDITSPHGPAGIRSLPGDPPVNVIWHSGYHSDQATYDGNLGKTVSVPGFYYARTAARDDYRLIFASGYGDGSVAQGKTLVSVSVDDGRIVDSETITPASCAQEPAVLTDVATAKEFGPTQEQQLIAAYFGDTTGNLWRYVPDRDGAGSTLETGAHSLVHAFGCGHPLHLAPATVQLDRFDATHSPGQIFLVQATNSAFDPETKSFTASKLVIRKDVATSGVVAPDTSFGTAGNLEVATGGGICAELGATCTLQLPTNARPISTPSVVAKEDGSGFQLLTTWHVPAIGGCDPGVSYLTLHEVTVTGTITQLKGFKLADEVVPAPVFVGTKILYSVAGTVTEITSSLGQTFVEGTQVGGAGSGSATRFRRINWSELP